MLLDSELARAVRTGAAAAVCYWWGVSHGVVQRWRKFLDVGWVDNAGTRRLVQASAEAGGEAMKAREWTTEKLQAMRERSKALDVGRQLTHGYHGPRWTDEEFQLLGTLSDSEVARLDRERGAGQARAAGHPALDFLSQLLRGMPVALVLPPDSQRDARCAYRRPVLYYPAQVRANNEFGGEMEPPCQTKSPTSRRP
jgi:hypothetical protein